VPRLCPISNWLNTLSAYVCRETPWALSPPKFVFIEKKTTLRPSSRLTVHRGDKTRNINNNMFNVVGVRLSEVRSLYETEIIFTARHMPIFCKGVYRSVSVSGRCIMCIGCRFVVACWLDCIIILWYFHTIRRSISRLWEIRCYTIYYTEMKT